MLTEQSPFVAPANITRMVSGKFTFKLPGAPRWFLSASITAAATLANAAPAETAAPGYYLVERDVQLQVPTAPKMGVRMGNHGQGRFDWEAGAANGKTARKSYDAPPEHQCLPVEMSRENWLSALRSACPGTIGRPCKASEVQVQREAADQWKLSYPVRLGGSNNLQGIEQLRRTLSDPRVVSGMSPQERAQVQAGLQQLPSASAIKQSNAQLAQVLEAQAASKTGPEAEMLREQARRLRTGNTEPIMAGATVERWTRISAHCPK